MAFLKETNQIPHPFESDVEGCTCREGATRLKADIGYMRSAGATRGRRADVLVRGNC